MSAASTGVPADAAAPGLRFRHVRPRATATAVWLTADNLDAAAAWARSLGVDCRVARVAPLDRPALFVGRGGLLGHPGSYLVWHPATGRFEVLVAAVLEAGYEDVPPGSGP